MNYVTHGFIKQEKKLEFNVIVTDKGIGIVRNDTALVKLTIEDADDQAPVFTHGGHFRFSIEENLPENTFIDIVSN